MRQMGHKSNGNAVNLPMLSKVLGQLLMVETAFMAVPLVVCLLGRESDAWSFAAVMALTGLTGACHVPIVTSCAVATGCF